MYTYSVHIVHTFGFSVCSYIPCLVLKEEEKHTLYIYRSVELIENQTSSFMFGTRYF